MSVDRGRYVRISWRISCGSVVKVGSAPGFVGMAMLAAEEQM